MQENNILTVRNTKYRSAVSGFWQMSSTWEIWDGNNWVAATCPPGASNEVWLMPNITVTVQSSMVAYCRSLGFIPQLSGIGQENLILDGNIFYYEKFLIASGDPLDPQPASGLGPDPQIILGSGRICRTGASGNLVDRGLTSGTRRLLGDHTKEFVLDEGEELVYDIQTMRNGKMLIFRGGTHRFIAAQTPDNSDISSCRYPTGGTGDGGQVIIGDGSTLIPQRQISGRQQSSSIFALENFILEKGCKLIYDRQVELDTPAIDTLAYNMAGEVCLVSPGDMYLPNKSILVAPEPGIDITDFSKVLFGNFGSKKLAVDTTINEMITFRDAATFDRDGRNLIYGDKCDLTYMQSGGVVIGQEILDNQSGGQIPRDIYAEDISQIDCGGKTINIRGTIMGSPQIVNGTINENQP